MPAAAADTASHQLVVFALAPPDRAEHLPTEVVWQPLAGHPLVRRTWAVWPAEERRQDLATFVQALDLRDDDRGAATR